MNTSAFTSPFPFVKTRCIYANSRTRSGSLAPSRVSSPRCATIRAHAGCDDATHTHEWHVDTRDADAVVSLVAFNSDGLVPAVAQQWDTKEVLMMAWMNEEALRITVDEQRAVYYSRSRAKLWRKGESSGNVQTLHDLRVDCDGDTILLLVDQQGPACHTGRRSCFYLAVRDGEVQETCKPLRDPLEMYGANYKH